MTATLTSFRAPVKKVDCETDDLGFAGFIATYQSLDPWRCRTDPKGKATFIFKVSSQANWEQWKEDYQSDRGCVGIKSFVESVRTLQRMGDVTHTNGGIFTVARNFNL